MTGKTHIVGGIATTVTVAHFTDYHSITFVAAGVLGAIIPDICHSGSKIGRKLPLLSKFIQTLFGHRTFTHSLLFLCLIGYLLTYITSNQAVILGGLWGIASHLLLDAGTKNGIKLLFPLDLTVRLPITIKTGGQVENLILLGLIIIITYFAQDIVYYYL
ncbi:inner membrane protein YdjM [Paraliobacillus ryukyuensis]|uniref:Inner membrane protein n=1 Tax=Paraliobacillus ryukyuensis TaxID=200904 RepID=A0A366DYV8_9BACI|nr:metal-dependent hydrolase [Paraliobacillus ryukyuensis]RBO95263.1 inner membrane protein [Paraliobacillus ryukyuensis]